jgi:ribose transport system substrate-binding protein
MKITIKDIAREAGVSIATVSHVINATRYVSPELVEKIRRVIDENHYHKGIAYKAQAGKRSQIAFLVPRFEDYAVLGDILSERFSGAGYTVSLWVTQDDIKNEKNLLTALLSGKSLGGSSWFRRRTAAITTKT